MDSEAVDYKDSLRGLKMFRHVSFIEPHMKESMAEAEGGGSPFTQHC